MTTSGLPRLYDSHWIGGRWDHADAETGIEVEDPSDETCVAVVPAGTASDARRAVAAARAALPRWSATPLSERGRFLSRLVEGLRARTGDLVNVITSEVGAPCRTAQRVQVGLAVAIAESYVDIASTFAFERRVGNSLVVVREQAGVVACITPWNVPLLLTMQKLAPAVVAGCTVVLKPSEITPLNTRLLAEIIADCDAPPGLVNVVFGTGPEVGAELARDPGVDLVSLTGSIRAGKEVAALAAEAADGYRVGDPRAAETDLGPLVSWQAAERVRGYIRRGIEEGARLITGGPNRPAELPVGHYVRPTVFGDVDNKMTIAREEIFEPVLSVIPYDTEEDAIRIANDTPYGLHGAVWSASTRRRQENAHRVGGRQRRFVQHPGAIRCAQAVRDRPRMRCRGSGRLPGDQVAATAGGQRRTGRSPLVARVLSRR